MSDKDKQILDDLRAYRDEHWRTCGSKCTVCILIGRAIARLSDLTTQVSACRREIENLEGGRWEGPGSK